MRKMAIMNDCLVSGLVYQDTVGPQSPELRALRWAAERGMCQLAETHHPNRMIAVRAVFGNEEDLAFFHNFRTCLGRREVDEARIYASTLGSAQATWFI